MATQYVPIRPTEGNSLSPIDTTPLSGRCRLLILRWRQIEFEGDLRTRTPVLFLSRVPHLFSFWRDVGMLWGMKLTDNIIAPISGTGKAQKLFDGGGLFLLVTPAGGKWWRLKYRFGGKEKQISFGVYPDVSLEDARNRKDAAKRLLSNGIDPSEERKDRKKASQFTAEINFIRDKIAEIAQLAVRNNLSLEVAVGVRVPDEKDKVEVQPMGTFIVNCSGKNDPS